MAPFNRSPLLFPLLLASLFTVAISTALQVSVHIISNLPAGSPPVTLTCAIDGSGGDVPVSGYRLKVGEDLLWKANADKTYDCTLIWTRYFASLKGYEVDRDRGRTSIFWKVDKDGFSISYDNKRYKWVEPWETD
ncbi:hypothetical protein NMG60_11026228 [Bertholletia excelsa]